MLGLVGLVLLISSVALVIYDVAVYFKSGREFVLITTEKLWNLVGGQGLFEARPTLTSALGNFGDTVADLPAVTITFSLGLVLAFIGWRLRGRSV